MNKHRFAAGVLGMALFVAMAGVAAGHAEFESADPAPGTSLEAAPETITIWFTQSLQAPDSWIRVFTADGVRVDQNDSRILSENDHSMVVSLRSGLGEGAYSVSWQSLAADGDGLTGSFQFGIRQAASAETQDDHSDSDGHDHSDGHSH